VPDHQQQRAEHAKGGQLASPRGAAWTTDRRSSIKAQSISFAISSGDDLFTDASNSVS
jgi:hypothetical protein